MNRSLLITLTVVGLLVIAGVGVFIFTRLNPNFLVKNAINSSNKVSSCVVLDEPYCKSYQVIKYNNKFFGLGFKLPSNAKLYSPFKALVSTGSSVTIKGKSYDAVHVTEEVQGNDNPQMLFAFISHQSISADLIAKVKQGVPIRLQPGDLIANVSNQTVDVFGDYNLVLAFWRFNPSTHLDESNADLTKQFFAGVTQ